MWTPTYFIKLIFNKNASGRRLINGWWDGTINVKFGVSKKCPLSPCVPAGGWAKKMFLNFSEVQQRCLSMWFPQRGEQELLFGWRRVLLRADVLTLKPVCGFCSQCSAFSSFFHTPPSRLHPRIKQGSKLQRSCRV